MRRQLIAALAGVMLAGSALAFDASPMLGGVLAGGAEFKPTDIANLSLWLDASDADTITDDGTYILTWADKSGNGYHARQPAGFANFNKATYDAANDRVLFPISGSYAITNFPAQDSQCAFFVLTPTQVTASDHFWGMISGGADRDHYGVQSATAAGVGFKNAFSSTVPFAFANNTMCLFSANRDATSVSVYSNGVFSATVTPTGGSLIEGPRAIGGYYAVGTGIYTTSAYAGYISEVLIYGAKLSDTNRAKVETYLKAKWGL
jgi:hypothetical protein